VIDPDLLCPHCEQHGFVLPTRLAGLEELLGVICHCCGHFMDKEELEKALDERPNRAGV
jgi:hypothetical protein